MMKANISVIEKIKLAYNSGGLFLVLLRTFSKIKNYLFKIHSSYWYVRDLREPLTDIRPKVNITIEFGLLEETLEWEETNVRKQRFYSEDLKEIAVAKNYQHQYVTAKCEQQIVGFLKIGFQQVYFKEYLKSIEIPKQIAFIYDTYVHPDYRGLNIAPYLINDSIITFKTKGIKTVMCHILPTNLSSRRTYSKLGFIKVKNVLYLRIFGFKLFNHYPGYFLKKLKG